MDDDEEQPYGRRKIERILPRPTDGFMDKSKDGTIHKLREAHLKLLIYLFLIMFVLLDGSEKSGSKDSSVSTTSTNVGNFPYYELLKRE